MFIESVMVSNHLILCLPLPLLPSVFPSIRIFSNELAFCIRQPKCWSLRFSISPSNEYTGLISFRTDWFDLLAVLGTLKSLLAYFSSTYTKIGTVQRLAWPLCKDDMQIHEVIHMKKKVFFSTTIQKHQFFSAQPSFSSNSQHLYMTTGKNHSFDSYRPLSTK